MAAAPGEPFYADPTFWVGVSFVAFMGGMAYLKLHKKIAGGLDARAERIKKELEEARILKEEAQSLLAQFQRRQRDAAKEAEAISKQAADEAKVMADEARANVEVMIERRTQLAADRIVQAEANAVKEVRRAAVEVATSAARAVIEKELSREGRAELVDKAIGELDKQLH